jgi:hypothetical protein
MGPYTVNEEYSSKVIMLFKNGENNTVELERTKVELWIGIGEERKHE